MMQQQQQQHDPQRKHNRGDASQDMTRRMICGGLAGCIAKTATNPLERIKMLSQTGEHGLKQTSVVSLYRNILKNEGVIGLWAGNGTNLLRIFPAKALVFSANDLYQDMFRRLLSAMSEHNTHHDNSQNPGVQKLPNTLKFLSGGFAGMTASACTYPLDLARGRISGKLASRASDGVVKKEYKGIVSTVLLTVREEGFSALYKGVTPTLMGALPYEGIKFGTVGVLDTLFPASSFSASPAIRKMVFGGMGGVAAGVITYPNDTVRRLLQLQGSRGTETKYSGYWDCVRTTYRAEGLARFYRGATINILRMAPNSAVQFGAYEILKEWTSDL
jgi:solute carrier family 25 phosphate transporter 23/24/25/41